MLVFEELPELFTPDEDETGPTLELPEPETAPPAPPVAVARPPLPPVAVLEEFPPVADEVDFEPDFDELLLDELEEDDDEDVVLDGVEDEGSSHSNVSPCTVTTCPGPSPVPAPVVPFGTCTRICPVLLQFHASDVPQRTPTMIAKRSAFKLVSLPEGGCAAICCRGRCSHVILAHTLS